MPSPSRFHSLDALRGIAALAVVFWHWQNFFFDGTVQSDGFRAESQPLYLPFKLLYDSGNLAVDLFFSLSGFIFFWLYAQAVAERRVTPWQFFVLRFSRLYPLHIVTLLLVAAGQAIYIAGHGSYFVYPLNDLPHFVLHLLLLPSIGLEQGYSFNTPVWSVSVEAVLYLLFFAVCWTRMAQPWVLAVLAVFGLFLLSRLYLPLGRGVGSFFLGACTHVLYARMLASPHRRRITRLVCTAAAMLWAATLACTYAGVSLASVPGLKIFHWKFPLVVLFPVTILALALAEAERGSLGRRLSFLGDISYSSYLCHFPLQLAFGLSLPLLGLTRDAYLSPWCLGVFFALLLLVSMSSYRYLEMPAQAWLRRVWLKRVPRPAPPLTT